MRKCTLFSTIAVCLIAPLSAMAQNLVSNGDFESGYNSGWNHLAGDGGSATYAEETADPYEGVKALRAQISILGINPWSVQSLGPTMSMEVGADYTLTFWGKAASAGTSFKTVVQTSNFLSQSHSLGTNWAQYTWNFTAVETGPSVRLQYTELGTVWVDDIQITADSTNSSLAVTNFTLINAESDSVIAELPDGGTIDLTTSMTRNQSIRAEVDSPPGSVVFELDGDVYHTEEDAPFALGGHSNGNYFAWTPEVGSHTLTATPYSDTNGTGTAGTELTISFTVTDDYSHRLGGITVYADPGVPVTIEQTRHDFTFGAMLKIDGFNGSMSASDEAQYRATFLSNFNYSVHGNAMKWYSTEPDWWKPSNPDSPPRWSNADTMLDWCESNGIPMRGHTLFWGANHSTSNGVAWTPDWVEALNDTDLENEIRIRATNTTTRFAGRIDNYDLNNEMMHGNFFKDRLGWGIVSNMAAWAKQGDPNCTLYANDFNVLMNGDPATYVSHINTLLANGVDIDGVGCQGHFGSTLYSQAQLKAKLDTLASLGMPIKITEYDLNSTDETKKRDGLENLFRACFAHANVNGIIQWGFWEGAHWRPDAALWNTDWSPTLAANKYRELVFDEWWTVAGGDVPSGGKYPFRAFLGTYTVTIDGIENTVILTPDKSEVGLVYNGSTVTTNEPLQVSAGADIALRYPTLTASVSGAITDPGAGAPTSAWTQVSGPGTVTFGSPDTTNTTVTLPSAIGSYVLRFYADNGFTDDHDDLTIALQPAVSNLISNPGFETGTLDGWTQHAGLTLTVTSDEAHEGTYSCLNSGRNAPYDGVATEIKGVLSNGVTYVISAWAKLANAPSASVKLTVKKIEDGGPAAYKGVSSAVANDTSWTRISGEYTVSTTGTVDTLLLYMDGPGATTNYWADNFACYEGTIAALDVDVDGIPDEWEWQNFESIDSSDGTGDQDQDGLSDLKEYLAGTIPTDSSSVLAVTGAQSDSSPVGFVISWQAVSNRTYMLLEKQDLLDTVWTTNAMDIPGTEPTCVHTVLTTSASSYYRIAVQD